MPQVGGKQYAYTKEGKAAAKKEAQTGRKTTTPRKPKKR